MTARPTRMTRDPLWWLIGLGVLFHLSGLLWGVPGPDSWANDSVASRDHLAGVALSLQPGSYFRYPLLHLLALALLNLPAVLAAWWHTAVPMGDPAFQPAFIAEITREPYMSLAMVTGRLVTVAMSAVAMWAVYRLCARIWTRRAGLLALCFLLGTTWYNYYSHTTNLDLPAAMWVLLTLERSLVAALDGRRRDYWLAGLFAALAVGTKDQSAAALMLSVPAVVAGGLWTMQASERRRALVGWLQALGVAAVVYLLASGAAFNPAGYLKRVGWLLGSASQDWTEYTRGAAGRSRLLVDIAHALRVWAWPPLLGTPLLAATPVALAMALRRPRERWTWLVPAALALSMTLIFNLGALRASVRFMLPQLIAVACYGGFIADLLLRKAAELRPATLARWAKWAMALTLALLIGRGLLWSARVNYSLYNDGRYTAERWMLAHTDRDTTVEVYAKNYSLPRLPPWVRAWRVRDTPLERRNPIVGLQELREPLSQIDRRRPDVVVLVDYHYLSFLRDPGARGPGKIDNVTTRQRSADTDARRHFEQLLAGTRGYKEVLVARTPSWGPLTAERIHASTSPVVHVLTREDWTPRKPPWAP